MFGLENYIITAIVAVIMLIFELLTSIGFGLAAAITMFIVTFFTFFLDLNLWQILALSSFVGIFVTYFVMKKFKKLNNNKQKDVNDYSSDEKDV